MITMCQVCPFLCLCCGFSLCPYEGGPHCFTGEVSATLIGAGLSDSWDFPNMGLIFSSLEELCDKWSNCSCLRTEKQFALVVICNLQLAEFLLMTIEF